MFLSVAICTWNRSHLLRQTLEWMASVLRVPDGVEWELLVVNNNCSDDTDAVIAGFGDRLPVRRLFEPRQGLANARNLATAEARGDYIVWTDDDVLVDAAWLEEYCLAFRRWPEAAVFGGPIEAWFPCERPGWLEEVWPLVETSYAILDLGADPIPLTRRRVPYGANLALRLEVQRRFPYDARLGYCGHGRIGGEETTVARAVLAEGESGWWVPSARVRHFIPPERLSVDYLRASFRGQGMRMRIEAGDGARSWRTLLSCVARLTLGEVAFRVGRICAGPRFWVRALRASSIARGYVEGPRRREVEPAALPGGETSLASTW